VRAVYTALGNRIHLDKQPLGRDLYVAALVEAGLPTELADAADTTDYDETLLAGNQAGLGPVVADPPRRGRWPAVDGVLLVSGTPGFFEPKRARTRPVVT
jgi:hypothetical protein